MLDSGPLVLVVEDDVATRALLAAVANRCFCRVKTAGDGEMAMALIRAECPDAMVLDVFLPKVDGLTVLRHIRDTVPDLLDRTIVITAAPELALNRAGDAHLVRNFLRKPLDLNEVMDELYRCTAMARERTAQ